MHGEKIQFTRNVFVEYEVKDGVVNVVGKVLEKDGLVSTKILFSTTDSTMAKYFWTGFKAANQMHRLIQQELMAQSMKKKRDGIH